MGNAASAEKFRRQKVDILNETLRMSVETFLGDIYNEKSITSLEIEKILELTKKQQFKKGANILTRDSDPAGILFLVSGDAAILAADEETEISSVPVGGYFGDTSVLYKTPVTATVIAVTRCKVNLLPASEVTLLLQDAGPLPNMADWCIKRRILKTHPSIDKDAQSILHSIALNTLKQVPLFKDWLTSDLNLLLNKTRNTDSGCSCMKLYPRGSNVLCSWDPADEFTVLVSGRASIFYGNGNKTDIQAWRFPFSINEEGLYVERPLLLSLIANSACWVMKFRYDDLSNMEKKPKSMKAWNTSKKCWMKHLFLRSSVQNREDLAHVQIELIYKVLRSFYPCEDMDPSDVYLLAIKSEISVYDNNLTVTTSESYDKSAWLIMKGSLVLLENQQPIYFYREGHIFYSADQLVENLTLVTAEESLLAKIPSANIPKSNKLTGAERPNENTE